MYQLIKKSIAITLAAISCVILGHLILHVASDHDHVADSRAASNESSVVISN